MKAALALVLAAFLTLFAPAQADASGRPDDATTKIAPGVARAVVGLGVRRTIAAGFPRGGRWTKVDQCKGGPYVWKCPVTTHGGSTTCTLTGWVWADASSYYVEWHDLECETS